MTFHDPNMYLHMKTYPEKYHIDHFTHNHWIEHKIWSKKGNLHVKIRPVIAKVAKICVNLHKLAPKHTFSEK